MRETSTHVPHPHQNFRLKAIVIWYIKKQIYGVLGVRLLLYIATIFILTIGLLHYLSFARATQIILTTGVLSGIIFMSELARGRNKKAPKIGLQSEPTTPNFHSSARFEKLAANVPGMIYQFLLHEDGSFSFPYVSSYCREIFELEPEQLQQNANLAIAQIHPEDRPDFDESINLSIQTLQPWQWQGRSIAPSGKLKWLSGIARPEKLASGDVLWDGLLLIDISDRKQSEAALQAERVSKIIEEKRERYLATLVEVQRCLLADDTDGDYYPQLLEPLGKAAGASRVYLFQNYRDSQGLLLMNQRGLWCEKDIPLEINNPLLQNLGYEDSFPRWAKILGTGEIISGIVADFPDSEREILQSQDILAILILPLIVNNQFWGFIGFDNCVEARLWEPVEVDLLAAATGAFALHQERALAEKALQKAKDELEHRVERRTKALREANQQLLVEIKERSTIQNALQVSEARSRKLARQEELINSLATQIRNSLELDTILETTVQKIRELLLIDRCNFMWFKATPQGGVWQVVKQVHDSGLPPIEPNFSVTIGNTSLRRLGLQMLRVDKIEDVTDNALQALMVEMDNQALLSLPVRTEYGKIGVLSCGQSKSARHWSDWEIELLLAVVNQLAIAIDQAYLYAQAQKTAQMAQARNHQLQQTLEKLQKTQAQLVQSEKMSSLGSLVAGVAHEINNPVSFITGNLVHAEEYIENLLNILDLYEQHHPTAAEEIVKLAREIDLDFVKEDLPKLLASMQLGAKRISEIVISLRNFSRLDEAEMKYVNLHEGIDSTLLILQNRLKPNGRNLKIEVVKEYGELPSIECYPGKLNQVFMNILSNAIDALELQRTHQCDADREPPNIRISTEIAAPGKVRVKISDNGCGMPAPIKAKIFDPFFTTKPVGSGTGLGLSISYQIVVENHKGSLTCNSLPGVGTEFCIEIPICQTRECC